MDRTRGRAVKRDLSPTICHSEKYLVIPEKYLVIPRSGADEESAVCRRYL